MKDYNKAIENYNKAIRYAPKFEMAYKNLAVNYYNIGNDSACINALSKVNISNEPVLVNLLNDAKKRIQSKQPN
jgi:tetratricopeptide (TPR) repeat protein